MIAIQFTAEGAGYSYLYTSPGKREFQLTNGGSSAPVIDVYTRMDYTLPWVKVGDSSECVSNEVFVVDIPEGQEVKLYSSTNPTAASYSDSVNKGKCRCR